MLLDPDARLGADGVYHAGEPGEPGEFRGA